MKQVVNLYLGRQRLKDFTKLTLRFCGMTLVTPKRSSQNIHCNAEPHEI